jgi:hypothetical protein
MADDHDARAAILARRARFMAAVMASSGAVTATLGCDSGGSFCRAARGNLPRAVEEGLGCRPSVCLSVEAVPPPVSPDAGLPDAGRNLAEPEQGAGGAAGIDAGRSKPKQG